MSSEQSPENEPGSENRERPEQRSLWREIGISAVAAAARYSYDKPATDPAAKGETLAGDAKIVTIRDIEHFAA